VFLFGFSYPENKWLIFYPYPILESHTSDELQFREDVLSSVKIRLSLTPKIKLGDELHPESRRLLGISLFPAINDKGIVVQFRG
jgi:hypothetical protein